jgi:hypothetical protein
MVNNKSIKQIYKTGTLWKNYTVSIYGFTDFQLSIVNPKTIVRKIFCGKGSFDETRFQNKNGKYLNFYHVSGPETRYELRIPKNDTIMLLEDEAIFYYGEDALKEMTGKWTVVFGERGISAIEKAIFTKFFVPL